MRGMDSFQEISVPSSLDGSLEPSLLWLPPGEVKALVVGLHTWSADRFNQRAGMLPYCKERGWALLLPEFRGPNLDTNPRAQEAGGSDVARRDIIDATRYILKHHLSQHQEKPLPLFLLGGSGGAHMSLMVAAREDFQWTAISSWCPITSLVDWHRENPNYAPHIAAICGGTPAEPHTAGQYQSRSPLCFAEALSKCTLQLAHGRHDASVPYTHGWKMAQAIEQFAPERFYFYLFDGTHELRAKDAFSFFDALFEQQTKTELTG